MDVFASENTVAGTYFGNFTLIADEVSYEIPVSVKVRDFVLTNENHVQTSFYLFPEYIMGGELDNTPEMYQKYVDYLLEYRISTTDIVYPLITDETEWVESIKKYAKNERVSSYNVKGATFGFEKEMRLLIENSTPELNLLEKAFCYLTDEPYDRVEAAAQTYYNRIDELIALADDYSEEELADHGLTKADIEGMEVLITINAEVAEIEGLRTYCSETDRFHTEAQRSRYEEYRANVYTGANGELEGTDYGTTWWYVCCYPREPYPNYHIDNDIVQSRVLSWMQYDYDIDGMLYWGTGSYFTTANRNDDVNGWQSIDVYTNPITFPGNPTNGDGYLLYPGAKYGEAGPLPSIRLLSIRDGFEDYEYLLHLETLMSEYLEKYDLQGEVDFDSIMKPIYETLYEGTIASTDYTRIMAARSTVMDMIEWLESDTNSFVRVNDIDFIKNEVQVDVFAKAGSYLQVGDTKINGVESGEGVKLSYTYKLSGLVNVFEATVVCDGTQTKIVRDLGSAVKVVSDFDIENDLSYWKEAVRTGNVDYMDVSLSDDVAYVLNGESSMHLVVDNGNWTAWETANFVSAISMSATDFFHNDKLSQVDYIELNLYSVNDVEYDFSLRFEITKDGKTRSKDFYTVTIKQGWNKIKIPYINEMSWGSGNEELLQYLSGIAFQFELIEEDIDVYIDSVIYTYVNQ